MSILDLFISRERQAEVKRVYGIGKQPKREIRHTAVGWQPNESYAEDERLTPSGEREFYRVEKKAGNP